ncbi:MAG TPA: hypothetical protein PKC55_07525 [Dysgonomonas sp.]|uniref:hypothetical protein n=1 Tax=unclassified Dysgonomonas TaxID=2630389 RepID=UPI0025BE87EF|nr:MULTISPECIES: hypothetical protein [unclassified Dysgonomonas]HML64662.1 hypothetical protein [Dysgonomonas sp.]
MIKGLDTLAFLTSNDKKLLQKSEQLYKQHARIEFEVLCYDEPSKELIVKVWQGENSAENYLSAADLISRTKDVFNMLPPDVCLYVRPVPYSKDRLQGYTIDDVRTDMEKYGLQQKDLVKLLDIDKTSINRLLNEGRELTKYQKAMFYYLFEFLRFNKK